MRSILFDCTSTLSPSPLSLHDALPIYPRASAARPPPPRTAGPRPPIRRCRSGDGSSRRRRLRSVRHRRSEEHTSELQSPCNLVCRLLLEKKDTRMGKYIDGYDTVEAYF